MLNTQYLLINGEVITVNNKNEIQEAAAVKGNNIIAVGSTEEILQLKDENSIVIDLEGKTLMPGFIDSHTHITIYGTNQLSISCKSENIKSINDLLTELEKRAQCTEKGKW
ncbi:MAG TPA: amidohydrolase family protein, partial [Chondromyces sp.]|nr:amidohydrolase family protein [Chondromyces sp.]